MDDGWWLAVGAGGQALFMARFVIQWLASERRGRSIIPVAFWYCSILGALVLLAYAAHRRDPVFVVGQVLGVLIYLRNLRLVRLERSQASPGTDARPYAGAGRPGRAGAACELRPGKNPDSPASGSTTPGSGRH